MVVNLISIFSKNMYTRVAVRLINLPIVRKILRILRNINLEDYIGSGTFLADWRAVWPAEVALTPQLKFDR